MLQDLNKGVKVVVENDDPNNPLSAISSFEQLNM